MTNSLYNGTAQLQNGVYCLNQMNRT